MTLSTEQIDELRRYVRRNIAIPKKYMDALLDTAEEVQRLREALELVEPFFEPTAKQAPYVSECRNAIRTALNGSE